LGFDLESLPRTLYDLLLQTEPAPSAQEIILPTSMAGVSLIPANSQLANVETQLITRINRERTLGRVLRPLSEAFDIVLIDCPAGIEQGFRNAVAGAQEAIIVTTPEVSAVRDADRVAGLLPNDMPARLIINRLRPQLVRKGTMMSVDDVLEILRLDLVGVVPDDKEVIVATNRGNPVIDISTSPTGAAIRRIASRLLGEQVPIPDFPAQQAWFARVLSGVRFPRPPSAKG